MRKGQVAVVVCKKKKIVYLLKPYSNHKTKLTRDFRVREVLRVISFVYSARVNDLL